MNELKQFIAHKTLKLRHKIVKVLAKGVYAEHVCFTEMLQDVGCVPRPMTLFNKDHFRGNLGLTCAEIGVAQGWNALNMLQELPVKQIFLIDPYTPYVEDGKESARFSDCLATAKDRLALFPQATFIKKTSDDAVVDVDEELDFVYIDGNHTYENVKRDIANYFPLIKPKGVIGGHDYVPYYFKGVIKAVNEFAAEYGKQHLHISYPDWWIVKQ
ncbi:class I SAM-dependent methyltransferase [Candidatus Bathyarchaeota archaeon]|nr:class I SAM-dependent methyltransferase [Candidatus Bathyarchaeota archaeon]